MNNLCLSKVISKNCHPRPLNSIPLLPFGPTDCGDYLRRQTKKKFIEFVCRHFIENEAEEVGKGREWDIEEGARETCEDWVAPEFVYEVNNREDEEDGEDGKEEDDEDEDEVDEETGGMESVELVGPGLESMKQVIPKLEPDVDIFSSLHISQEEIENCEPFADISGDCSDSMDILVELFGSDLENGK